MRVLVVNAGSSSLKLRLVDGDDRVEATADLPADGGSFDDDALADALDGMGRADAVGHRVVHGGPDLVAPTLVTPALTERLRGLVPLAPLHEPAALAGMAAVGLHRPGIPNVACFDTAFHASLPAAARTYPLPRAWREGFGLRRYGFHGLSHAWAAMRGAELLGRPPEALRLVTCHLGAGASLAAVRGGRSVDTTMGFTPLEGLMMATRAGSTDPGLLLWLQEEGGVALADLRQGLEHGSGLVGLAGTADMREVVERAAAGEADAGLALDVFVHRARAGVAAMAAALDGVDGVVLTGGIAEHAPVVRRRIVEGLGFLGLRLDLTANEDAAGDAILSAPGSPAGVVVVEAREDLQIAREVRRLLAGP